MDQVKGLQIIVMMKDIPLPTVVALISLPAHIPMVTGMRVAVCAGRVDGTPEGDSKMKLPPAVGHVPSEIAWAVMLGLSVPVPWLSMQKNCC